MNKRNAFLVIVFLSLAMSYAWSPLKLLLFRVREDSSSEARRIRTCVDLQLAANACCQYYNIFSDWPRDLEALNSNRTGVLLVKWTRGKPSDAWGNALQYRPPSSPTGAVYVFSYGSDGRPGGAGEGTDTGIRFDSTCFKQPEVVALIPSDVLCVSSGQVSAP